MSEEFSFPKATVRTLDCITGMRAMDPESVDVVVTSPPYNMGKAYSKYMDKRDQKEYLDWCRKWAKEVKRVLKPDGSFFLNLGSAPSNPTIPHALLNELIVSDQGGNEGFFYLQNNIHWIKSITILDEEGQEYTRGHFKPINSDRFVNDCHEYIFHLTPTGSTPLDRKAIGVEYKHKSNIARWGHTEGSDRRCRGNTWFLPYHTIQNSKTDRPHPASFPPELPENCIKLHGVKKGETVVLDPFLGIGNSWIGANRCKVGHFYGYDIDAEYVALARKYSKDLSLNFPGEPPKDKAGENFSNIDEHVV